MLREKSRRSHQTIIVQQQQAKASGDEVEITMILIFLFGKKDNILSFKQYSLLGNSSSSKVAQSN